MIEDNGQMRQGPPKYKEEEYIRMNWRDYFTDIYGKEAAKEWLPRLEKRIQEAGRTLQNKTADSGNQNVILITYPDQFYGEENKLTLFERFAEKYLDGVFDVIHFLRMMVFP